AAPPPDEVPALVLLWSRDEPERAGEVLLVPPDDRGGPFTFGRGTGKEGDPEPSRCGRRGWRASKQDVLFARQLVMNQITAGVLSGS
ncbi:MAG: hypothetical protein R3F14_41765, partial [Polyangiaceae bacterium]